MADECSTPVGVTEGITGGRHVRPPAVPGAQRLSASLKASRAETARAELLRKCSTPVGVTEGITPFEGEPQFEKDECSTPVGVTEGITAASTKSVRPIRRAQRLSASLKASPAGGTEFVSRPYVLNACRRH